MILEIAAVCEFCHRCAPGTNPPATWELVYQSWVCPRCQEDVPRAGGYHKVPGGAYATADDPRTAKHECTASNVAALVDAARDLLEYVEADLRRDREERRVPRPGLGVLADDLRAALGALR